MNRAAASGTGRGGLRTTITLSLALGALGISAAMAIGTYIAARNYLVDQREHTAQRQAFTDASYVRDGLLTSGVAVSDVLGAVSPAAEASVVVRRDDQWFSTSLQTGQDDIPTELRDQVAAGSAAMTWRHGADGAAMVVGVPLPAVDAQFFEIAYPSELERTLDALRIVLVVVAAFTAVAAGLLGRWAARRVITPLDDVASAAARISSGALDTRLPTTHDPDLVTIVASFNSMVDAVNERIERDARFAADVSHELRSPLTTLATSVDLLARRRGELSPRGQQVLDLVSRDLGRFQRALENLLDLGRLEAGASSLSLTPVDVSQLVRHTLEVTDHSTDMATTPETPVLAEADKATLHRALVNLFENADRHGSGLTGVAVVATESTVAVHVDDAGRGVAPEDRERIFERFARGGSRGSLPGTGLGLNLVLEAARAHRGSVCCSAGPRGYGARFTFQLARLDLDEVRQ